MASFGAGQACGIGHHRHSFESFGALDREGLLLASRRNLLKSSLAGIAGLSLPTLLLAREPIANGGLGAPKGKSVILLWMTGGPSQIDTWDPKPDRPIQNRGPFGVVPGVLLRGKVGIRNRIQGSRRATVPPHYRGGDTC